MTLRSPSFPDGLPELRSEQEVRAGRAAYEIDLLKTIENICRPVPLRNGMSDDQRDNEWGCQKRLYAAVAELIEAAKMVNESSTLRDIDMKALMAFIADEIPSEANWDEAISLARHP